MAEKVLMPKLGLTMTEGTIEEWKKKEGDEVKKGEILFSVATDKLTNDIEAEADGVLLKILVGEGEDAPCKAVIAWIGAPGEVVPGDGETPAVQATPETETFAPEQAAVSVKAEGGFIPAMPYARKLAKEKGIDLGLVPASGARGYVTSKDVLSYVPAAVMKAPANEVKASPLAEKVASDIGIDLASVKGRHCGRVLAEDIYAYLEETREKAEEEVPSNPLEEVKKMSGMRKAIAKNMLASVQTSPTVTFNLAVDMSEMKKYREMLKAKEIKVSYNDLVVKFVAKALTEFPILNASVDGNSIILKHYVNMGVAVAIDDGLLVPNIKDCDKKSLTEIHDEVKTFAEQARSGKLPMEALKGGTFTITNLGMYGIDSFTPIINQPEVAILGLTTMEDKAVVRNGEIVIRPMMTLSLTADHRIIDGATAAEFLQRVKNLLENPALMLA
ncbi:MAG: 2-oxo acid dehydrogenase subunit E2 [Oscillospiraceae bacterium]|jgi:pyruvate dehydrogenase E2 component (dihydrolipoamide acetyltransferase)|nr:2-oxo acid dehydrogenase subunit E2 [Oscillospiraceae bacterium]MBQ2146199.1 2-oxo acid dehydrogenase subunit E2 [Oscillospiraceae bacterium]